MEPTAAMDPNTPMFAQIKQDPDMDAFGDFVDYKPDIKPNQADLFLWGDAQEEVIDTNAPPCVLTFDDNPILEEIPTIPLDDIKLQLWEVKECEVYVEKVTEDAVFTAALNRYRESVKKRKKKRKVKQEEEEVSLEDVVSGIEQLCPDLADLVSSVGDLDDFVTNFDAFSTLDDIVPEENLEVEEPPKKKRPVAKKSTKRRLRIPEGVKLREIKLETPDISTLGSHFWYKNDKFRKSTSIPGRYRLILHMDRNEYNRQKEAIALKLHLPVNSPAVTAVLTATYSSKVTSDVHKPEEHNHRRHKKKSHHKDKTKHKHKRKSEEPPKEVKPKKLKLLQTKPNLAPVDSGTLGGFRIPKKKPPEVLVPVVNQPAVSVKPSWSKQVWSGPCMSPSTSSGYGSSSPPADPKIAPAKVKPSPEESPRVANRVTPVDPRRSPKNWPSDQGRDRRPQQGLPKEKNSPQSHHERRPVWSRWDSPSSAKPQDEDLRVLAVVNNRGPPVWNRNPQMSLPRGPFVPLPMGDVDLRQMAYPVVRHLFRPVNPFGPAMPFGFTQPPPGHFRPQAVYRPRSLFNGDRDIIVLDDDSDDESPDMPLQPPPPLPAHLLNKQPARDVDLRFETSDGGLNPAFTSNNQGSQPSSNPEQPLLDIDERQFSVPQKPVISINCLLTELGGNPGKDQEEMSLSRQFESILEEEPPAREEGIGLADRFELMIEEPGPTKLSDLCASMMNEDDDVNFDAGFSCTCDDRSRCTCAPHFRV